MPDKKYSLKQLAEMLTGEPAGPHDLEIYGVGDLAQADENQISFIADKKYLPQLSQTRACAVVTSPQIKVEMPAIIVQRPDLAFAKLLEIFAPPLPHPPPGKHPSAVVEATLDPTVAVGANCYIGPQTLIGPNTVIYPNVYIGPNAKIGKDCLLWPGVVIRERVIIGDRVIIHPNACIGADGFGYNLIEGKHVKINHIGTVIVENDVEIGAGACIDRAKAGATTIGFGSKIDNLVQIGHNVTIGPNSILVGHVAIAGSATLGAYVVLGGKVGVREHVKIGDKAKVAAYSLISKNVPPGLVVSGIPAIENHDYLRQQASLRRLPELAVKVTELTKKINELEQTIHNLKRSGA
ncbi:MAG: UDP-3-O-(3-hydroxymyristoyl)glucosamine N-acyltransferase [Phycisphaerae bacterium]